MVETQLDLPFSVEDCGGLNAIYVDQAPSHNRFGYASFFYLLYSAWHSCN